MYADEIDTNKNACNVEKKVGTDILYWLCIVYIKVKKKKQASKKQAKRSDLGKALWWTEASLEWAFLL